MITLDTNTVSDYFRGDAAVVGRLREAKPAEVSVPAIVACELRYDLLRLPEAASAPGLKALDAFLLPLTVLSFDGRAAELAARVRADLEAAGALIEPHDLLIAATALRHSATLVTRNVREFSRVPGLRWENWHDNK